MRIKEHRLTFIGCENEYKDSQIAVFGAPYDCTSSFRPGSRFAPAIMRNESIGIETYSPYLDLDLEDKNIFDGGDLDLPFGDTKKSLKIIEEYTFQIIKDNKKPLMIGGEHLVSLGAVKGTLKKYMDLCIVHFDAHTDLREDYLGVKLSHATVMRRIWELVGDKRIFQYGIRSGEKKEFLFGQEHNYLNKFGFDNLEENLEIIGDRPVYFTIDLDVLDTSYFCGTGTPEVGGVSFVELLEAIKKVMKKNVVACDINELSPIYDQSGSSTSIACKLLRELLLQL